jgi:hypothetical protein
MKVLNKSLKVVLLGSTLMTSEKAAADLTYTVDTYTSLMDTLAVGLDMPETDKAAEITGVPYGLDKGYLGTVAATKESYVWTDSATNLRP